jgi:hypothetical protein
MKATKIVSNKLFSFPKKFQLLSVVSIVFVLLNDGNVKAQSPTDGYVITTSGTNGNVNGFVHVDLPDTVSIASIEVKLGSAEGSANILQHVFMYDVSQGLPAGFTWQRKGNHVIINVGTIVESPVIFGRIRLQSTASVWSDAYSFVTN